MRERQEQVDDVIGAVRGHATLDHHVEHGAVVALASTQPFGGPVVPEV